MLRTRSSLPSTLSRRSIPGIARLVLELLVLGGAAFLLWRAGQPLAAGGFAALIVIDYVLQYDRVGRLIAA